VFGPAKIDRLSISRSRVDWRRDISTVKPLRSVWTTPALPIRPLRRNPLTSDTVARPIPPRDFGAPSIRVLDPVGPGCSHCDQTGAAKPNERAIDPVRRMKVTDRRSFVHPPSPRVKEQRPGQPSRHLRLRGDERQTVVARSHVPRAGQDNPRLRARRQGSLWQGGTKIPNFWICDLRELS